MGIAVGSARCQCQDVSEDPEERMRAMLLAELEDFDLDEEDFEAATDLAEQVQSMSEVVARGTERSVPLAVAETAQSENDWEEDDGDTPVVDLDEL